MWGGGGGGGIDTMRFLAFLTFAFNIMKKKESPFGEVNLYPGPRGFL